MSRIAVTFILLFSSVFAVAGTCGKRVSAFTTYDQLEGGHLVDKYSVFEVADWSNDSSFEGLLVGKDDEADTLRIQAKNAVTLALSSWTLDGKYRVAQKLDMQETVKDGSKSFKVQLVKNSKVLCEDTYTISNSGESAGE